MSDQPKRKRCPNGTRRDPKTGNCKAINPNKFTVIDPTPRRMKVKKSEPRQVAPKKKVRKKIIKKVKPEPEPEPEPKPEPKPEKTKRRRFDKNKLAEILGDAIQTHYLVRIDGSNTPEKMGINNHLVTARSGGKNFDIYITKPITKKTEKKAIDFVNSYYPKANIEINLEPIDFEDSRHRTFFNRKDAMKYYKSVEED